MVTLEHDPIQPEAPGNATSDLVTIKLDSCHSTWHFQPLRGRFRRQLKGLGIAGVSTGWRPYYGLRINDDVNRFTVLLDREGRKLLSSWCHVAGNDVCDNCAEHGEGVQAPDDISQVAP